LPTGFDKWNKNRRIFVDGIMSSAFVKESDDQWLEDISPTMNALISFLTRENNGVRVYETGSHKGEDGSDIFSMSNGLSYSKVSGRWKVII
jgi:hypothetical protein